MRTRFLQLAWLRFTTLSVLAVFLLLVATPQNGFALKTKKRKVRVIVSQNLSCPFHVSVSDESLGGRELCVPNYPGGAAGLVSSHIGEKMELEAEFVFSGDIKNSQPVNITRVIKVAGTKVYDPCSTGSMWLSALANAGNVSSIGTLPPGCQESIDAGFSQSENTQLTSATGTENNTENVAVNNNPTSQPGGNLSVQVGTGSANSPSAAGQSPRNNTKPACIDMTHFVHITIEHQPDFCSDSQAAMVENMYRSNLACRWAFVESNQNGSAGNGDRTLLNNSVHPGKQLLDGYVRTCGGKIQHKILTWTCISGEDYVHASCRWEGSEELSRIYGSR